MDDTVTHGENPRPPVVTAEPGRHGVEGGRGVVNDEPIQRAVGKRVRLSVRDPQPWRGADPFDLSPAVELPASTLWTLIDAELQARRAGIDDDGVIVHVNQPCRA